MSATRTGSQIRTRRPTTGSGSSSSKTLRRCVTPARSPSRSSRPRSAGSCNTLASLSSARACVSVRRHAAESTASLRTLGAPVRVRLMYGIAGCVGLQTRTLAEATRHARCGSGWSIVGAVLLRRRSLGDGLTCGECLTSAVCSGRPPIPQSPSGDSSTTTQVTWSHVLALDLDHGVGHAADNFLLLSRREHFLDDLDVDESDRFFSFVYSAAGQRNCWPD